jgi:hypothetical protein
LTCARVNDPPNQLAGQPAWVRRHESR